MKAIVHRRYGAPDVLHLEEIGAAAIGDDEVLVRVEVGARPWVGLVDLHCGGPAQRRPRDQRVPLRVGLRLSP